MPLPPEPTPEQFFLTHLPYIGRVATYLCRRHGFSREDTQDFISGVRCKIIEDDYAVIRKFLGKSKLKTFLTVVISNLFKDHQDHRLGKWRPSEEAKRLGPTAVRLERLLYRDRFTLAEACEILVTNYHVEATRQELEDLAAKLPHRPPPRPSMESEEALENRASNDLPSDEQIEAREAADRWQEILEILGEGLNRLPAEDALVARMRCEFKVSEIARRLGLEQKPLYRRLERILKELREYLESRGVRPEEIGGLLSIPEDDDEPSK